MKSALGFAARSQGFVSWLCPESAVASSPVQMHQLSEHGHVSKRLGDSGEQV